MKKIKCFFRLLLSPIHSLAEYLSADQQWNKAMASLVISFALSCMTIAGVVLYQTFMSANFFMVTKPLSVETFRTNGVAHIKYEIGIDAMTDFTGRFDKQLLCDSGGGDITDSIRDVKQGNRLIVRHAILPISMQKGDMCTLEVGVTTEIPFSLARRRAVLGKVYFVMN
ncbi:MAG: hypothetical protein K2Y28_01290 [Burkholderiaceae bacterium]|nr:hypothetical protein [Burkholderiaceae bacterium]